MRRHATPKRQCYTPFLLGLIFEEIGSFQSKRTTILQNAGARNMCVRGIEFLAF